MPIFPPTSRQRTLSRLMNHVVSRSKPASMESQHYKPAPYYGQMRRKNSWSCPSLAQGTLIVLTPHCNLTLTFVEVAKLDSERSPWARYFQRPAKSVSGYSGSSSSVSEMWCLL